jgi:hypothetical protein
MGGGRVFLAIIDRIREQWAILKKMGKYAALREEFWIGVFLACEYFYSGIKEKYRRAFFYKLRQLFLDLEKEGGFQYKYFSEENRRRIAQLLRGRYFASILTTKKKIRSFLFSIHIGRRDFIIQLLGLQISRGRYTGRPAFLAWRIE